MTDKELEKLAEKEAYKAIGYSKFHVKFAPFARIIYIGMGLMLMIIGADSSDVDPTFIIIGALLALFGYVVAPLGLGYIEADFEKEKAAAMERLRNGQSVNNGGKNNS